MMDIGAWLQSLGLEQYEAVFRANAVDAEVLPELGEADLEKLGVLLGHRKKLLKAIAALHDNQPSAVHRLREGTNAPPEAERRQLTVMFCDLVSSTALAARLDPEEMHEIIRAFQNAVTGEIARFEGHVAKFMGDGVLAYFGWPKAHEDEAERAVRAGLAIAEAVASMPSSGGTPLSVRIGVATGLVVVGDLIGQGEARERVVVGETPNLAARLQGLAPPGSVVVSETTRRLLGGTFDLDDLGPQTLKGLERPTIAYRVHQESAVEGRFEAHQAGQLLPMVGREPELATILDRWRQARTGEGQCVLLIGEAGIGKSRITQATLDALADEPLTVVSYQCSPYHVGSPLWPVVHHLNHVAGLSAGDSTEQRLAKLEAFLRPTMGDNPEAVHLLGALLGLDASAHYPPLDLTPQQRRARTLDILVEQVIRLAAAQPVVLRVEDPHWVDPTTLELIELILSRITQARVLMLLTARPSFQPSFSRHQHVTWLTLNRLRSQDARAIIDGVAGGKAVPDEVMGELLAKTDGVPLYLEELTRTVLESGLLRQTDTAYVADIPLPALAIPSSLHDSLMARLDRLRPVKEVAQTAACIGREFSYELLSAVAPVSEADLRDALGQLMAAELVFGQGAPPAATYTFKHALLRDAAYQSLLKSRRELTHRRIAQVLQDRFPSLVESQPELLARHYTEAGLTEPAIEAWRRAGARSAARSANHEAIGHFQRALDLLEKLAPSAQRDHLEADLRLAQVVPLIAVHGFGSPLVETCASRAKALGATLADWPGRFAAHRVVWNSCLMRHPVPRTVDLARELYSLATQDEDVVRLAIACRALGYTLFIAGEQGEADQLLERGAVLADSRPEAEFKIYGEQPQIVCRLYRGAVHSLLGFPEEAARIAEEGLMRARALNNPHTLAWSLVSTGNAHNFGRNAGVAERLGAEALQVSREHRLPQWLAFAEEIRGWALCQLGEHQEGLALLEDALRRLHATGAVLHTSRIGCYLAQGYLLSVRLDEARAHLAAARQHSETYGEQYMLAELYRQQAALLRAEKAPIDEVERNLQLAVTTAQRQAARLLELRAATDLAKLWAQGGERERAWRLLHPVCHGFQDGLRLSDVEEARSVLNTVS
ncbi:ATP-binding protein [Microvirga aerophila]|uniref:Adenylate cyclase n=1 Tax=Microvirga aerophila TaxID=670291 RepID=A0A512BYE7_9HYPH|nr:adenylate/guanylate cyclase domain-containing protein [Microvirga aerophila]GEO16975.1 adenylate cyclase [Microvirga aerophila]